SRSTRITRPPSSTPFPYTTLFRSVALTGALGDAGEHRGTTEVLGDAGDHLLDEHRLAHAGAAEQADLATLHVRGEQVDDLDAGLDRKSTRLNSSHVKISYAVFCLK